MKNHKIILGRCYSLVLIPFAAMLVVFVRILRPVLLVRLGPLASDRIGNFALFTEIFLCGKDAGLHSKNTFDIFYHASPMSNCQLKKMWERVLIVAPFRRLMLLAVRINNFFPGHEKHIVPIREGRDLYGLYRTIGCHVAFTAQEEKLGSGGLRAMGIQQDSPFVCFHSRDPLYLKKMISSRDWSYHDYRDFGVNDYAQAAEELARRGYYCLRMGAIVEERFITENLKIIDYAEKYRTDFLDIYLSSKCKFFIGCGSGIDEIPKLFRRPVVYVNFIPLNCPEVVNSVNLFIPKKIWSRKEKRLLTFKEIMDSEIGRFILKEDYESAGFDIINNTPEEIKAVIEEMDERLKGTWQTTDQDEYLQEKFWSLFKKNSFRTKIISRIGAEFLNSNKTLLN